MRIPPLSDRHCSWYLKPFFWNQQRNYGKALDASLLWARSPRLFIGVAALYGAIDRRSSPIDPGLRSLVTVRVSQINGCAFCVDLNSANLLRRGGSAAKALAVRDWRGSDLFTPRDQAALNYAEAMTLSGYGVQDSQFEDLRRHFTDIAIIELTALIAFQNLSSKFNAALDVQPQGFCELPGIVRGAGSQAVASAVSDPHAPIE